MIKIFLKRGAWPIFFFSIAIVAILLSGATADRSGLMKAALAAAAFQLGVLMLMINSRRFSLALFLMNFNNLIQSVFIFLYFDAINNSIVPGFGMDLADSIYEQFMGLSIIPISSLFIFPLFVKKDNFNEVRDIFHLITHPEKSYFVILWIYSINNLLSLVFNSAGLGGLLGYVTLLTEQSMVLAPLLIGLWYKKLPFSLRILTAFTVITQIVIVILSGNRFLAFLNIILLYIGFLVSAGPISKRVMQIAGILSIPVLLTILGIMGLVRDKIGRGNTADTFSEERFEIYKETFFEYLDKTGEDEALSDEAEKSSKGRNVNWVNTVVFAKTPDEIPYRGFDNLLDEILNLFRLTAFSSGFNQDEILAVGNEIIDQGFGNGMAKRYGFNVTASNGVEWSLLADAWSRGGILGCYIFMLLFVLLAERLQHFVFNIRLTEVKILLFIIFLNMIFFTPGARPFAEFIKYVFLRGLAAYLLLSFIFILIKAKNVIARRSAI